MTRHGMFDSLSRVKARKDFAARPESQRIATVIREAVEGCTRFDHEAMMDTLYYALKEPDKPFEVDKATHQYIAQILKEMGYFKSVTTRSYERITVWKKR